MIIFFSFHVLNDVKDIWLVKKQEKAFWNNVIDAKSTWCLAKVKSYRLDLNIIICDRVCEKRRKRGECERRTGNSKPARMHVTFDDTSDYRSLFLKGNPACAHTHTPLLLTFFFHIYFVSSSLLLGAAISFICCGIVIIACFESMQICVCRVISKPTPFHVELKHAHKST